MGGFIKHNFSPLFVCFFFYACFVSPLGLIAADENLKKSSRKFEVEMNPLVLTYIDYEKEKPLEFVIISYVPEAISKKAQKKLKRWKNRLHDKIMLGMRSYVDVIWRGKGPLNEEHLKQLYRKIFLQVMKEDLLADIKIYSAMTEKIY